MTMGSTSRTVLDLPQEKLIVQGRIIRPLISCLAWDDLGKGGSADVQVIYNNNNNTHFETTSGAIQYGVPTIVCRSDVCAQNPKSITFTSPFMPSRTLSLLMSLWMMLLLCRKATALKHFPHMPAIWVSRRTVSVTTPVSVPPSRNSITTHSSSLIR